MVGRCGVGGQWEGVGTEGMHSVEGRGCGSWAGEGKSEKTIAWTLRGPGVRRERRERGVCPRPEVARTGPGP